MKSKIVILSLLITFLAGCKKEEVALPPTTEEEQQQQNIVLNFSANEALVKSSSDFYLIADVEGMAGVTKLNIQDRKSTCFYGWSFNACPGASHCAGNFDFNYNISGVTQKCEVECGYYGTGEGRTGLITAQNTKFITPADEDYGIKIWLKAPDGTYYSSKNCNNPALTWTNIQLAERTAYGSSTTSALMPGYYVKLKFNCELASTANQTKKIRLKNAILRLGM